MAFKTDNDISTLVKLRFASIEVFNRFFGALNAGILTGPRVYFAQARDGLFFSQLAEVHPRFGTPAMAILLQGVWAAIL